MESHSYQFDIFRLCTRSERLFAGDVPVLLGHRAFRLLALLVERRGGVVRHGELIGHAWPDTVVEYSNLRVQITAIRRALRMYEPDVTYIRNVAGRGYRFIREEIPRPRADLSTVQPVAGTRPEQGSFALIEPPRRRVRATLRMVREGALERARRCLLPRARATRGNGASLQFKDKRIAMQDGQPVRSLYTPIEPYERHSRNGR